MITKSTRSILQLVFTVGAVAALAPAPAFAGYLTVVGGPTFTPGVGGGGSGRVWNLDASAAVGYVSKFDASGLLLETAPFRWSMNAPGTELQWTELEIPGNHDTVPGRPDNPQGYGKAMDAAGNVVGHVVDKYDGNFFRHRAVRWDADGAAATVLPNLGTDPNGYELGGAADVNAAGVIVGTVTKFDASGLSQGLRAVRWDASGAITELGTLDPNSTAGPTAYNGANAINDAGTAIGFADKFDASNVYQGQRAVRWDAGGTAATELANLGTDANGYTDTAALAINSAGVIVGSAWKFDTNGAIQTAPVRWDASGAITELESLEIPAGVGVAPTHLATDINEAGVAIGKFYQGGAVRWDALGAATELKSTLGRQAFTVANDINNAGVVVGDTFNNLLSRALYWGPDAVPVDLNSLIDPASGWKLTNANAINDAGWIAGLGEFDPDGPGGQAAYSRLFLMRVPAAAVPEPAAGTLALLGAAGIVVLRRRSLWRPHKSSL